uniref:Uncharacterized protein n=1 Tax=viral metagenome TaxID=1070528 RepID=A0A6H1ZE77_9ZZZZ
MLNKLKATMKHLQKKRAAAEAVKTMQWFETEAGRIRQEIDQPKR